MTAGPLSEATRRIAALNDRCRTALGVGAHLEERQISIEKRYAESVAYVASANPSPAP